MIGAKSCHGEPHCWPLIPTNEIIFVGFVLNSADMTEIAIGKEIVYFEIVP